MNDLLSLKSLENAFTSRPSNGGELIDGGRLMHWSDRFIVGRSLIG